MAASSPANDDSGRSTARGRVHIVTATIIPPLSPVQPAAPAARISLKPAGDHPGMVNGAWWPRSRDLARELPPLIAALDKAWGQVNRATVNVHMWPDIPRRVRTGTHTLRVGWFDAEQDPNDICLLSYHLGGRWDLLVVPPELDSDAAGRLMATAADTSNKQTVSSLPRRHACPSPRPTPTTQATGNSKAAEHWEPPTATYRRPVSGRPLNGRSSIAGRRHEGSPVHGP